MKKKTPPRRRISNRRARFDYELDESIIAGLALHGSEVRALRQGHGQLQGAYVTLRNGELWLINATISGSNGNLITESDKTRVRKVLVKQREIESMILAKQQGKTIVPLEILTGGRYIKLRLCYWTW